MTGWNYAEAFETIADTIPDAPALLHGDNIIDWATFATRADGLAQFLLDAGCSHQGKVGFYLYNRPEYLETFFACCKASLVHVNTNYRYTDDELVYIWDNADVEAVVFQGAFTESVERVMDRCPLVRAWIHVDDGTGPCPEFATPYEDAASTPNQGRVRSATGTSGDDLMFIYTGGTTGMPKGVMWRLDDHVLILDATAKVNLPEEADFDADGWSPTIRSRTTKPGPRSIPACPLMHGTGLFNSLTTLMIGGSVVTLTNTRFDLVEMLDTIEARNVKSIFIVGDAFAKPMVAALDAEPDRWDLSCLRAIISSGVMWSAETKEAFARHYPNVIQLDAYGSSEAISIGSSVASGESTGTTAKFELAENSVVIADDGSLVEPGSGVIGKLGVRKHTPIGYYKDPEKSAATFPVIDGVRYSVPGDFATVESDGSITLLGRGSVCINSGGEKIFPEEVEEVLKQFDGIVDAICVGVPDDRFGQAVTAVVAAEAVDEAAAISHVKSHLAAYKAPKRVYRVPSLERAANGKIDYKRWTAYAESQA